MVQLSDTFFKKKSDIRCHFYFIKIMIHGTCYSIYLRLWEVLSASSYMYFMLYEEYYIQIGVFTRLLIFQFLCVFKDANLSSKIALTNIHSYNKIYLNWLDTNWNICKWSFKTHILKGKENIKAEFRTETTPSFQRKTCQAS